jgi:phenylalanyl-tRNA synthetase beta chain
VIADVQGVESLAGIMGGDATAVSNTTQHVYVEAAFWWPEAISGRSRRFNFNTDAGHRFERGVDPALTVEHIERITRLIVDICGGEPGPMDDQCINLPQRAPVSLRAERAAKVIGMPVSAAQCAQVFQRLGFDFSQDSGRLTVKPPSWRFDLAIEEDLIEEVARVIGYDQLPATPPIAPVVPRIRPEAQRSSFAVRRALAALDFQETINFSFVEARWEHELHGNADPIRVLNPIAAPLAVMRSSLIGSLVQVLRHNLARKTGRVRVFELGRVAWRDAGAVAGALSVAGVAQPMRVAALAYGPVDATQWGARDRAVDFFDVKGDLETLLAPRSVVFQPAGHAALHPGRSARVLVDGQAIGFVGELHPRWRQGYELPAAPVLFELDLPAVQARPVPAFEALARHQGATRDLALVVPEAASHDGLIAALRADPSGLVRSATLFDVYKPAVPGTGFGPGERSLAVRLELLDAAATLTDERIDAAVAAALARAGAAQGARLRG